MSNQRWSDACFAARLDEAGGNTRSLLYGTHSFTIACFVLGSAFSGFWLNRWRCLKWSSNHELLLSSWRYTGLFLALSFTGCFFGVAAWISKLTLVYSNTELQILNASPNVTQATGCLIDFSLQIQGNRSNSAFRIFYSVEFACLFLSILLGLDRISEQALSAKALSRSRSSSSSSFIFQQPSMFPTAPQRLALAEQRLIETSQSRSPSDSRFSSFGKTRALHLVIKVGLAFVALCCLTLFISVITAAALQANMVSDFERAYRSCDSTGEYSQKSIEIQNAISAQHVPPFNKSIFTGFLCELAAAVVVILLYAAVGCMGFSIVSSARKKIDASRAKLQQLQTTIGSQHEAKAAAAGTATKIALARVSRASARVL
jgi:hypothetical protein